MQPDIQKLKDDYLKLTREYVDAVHSQEIARIEALPSANRDAIDEWQKACKNAEQINQRRLDAQRRLAQALG